MGWGSDVSRRYLSVTQSEVGQRKHAETREWGWLCVQQQRSLRLTGGWRRGVQTRLWPEVTRGGELMSRISEASPLSFLSWMMFM